MKKENIAKFFIWLTVLLVLAGVFSLYLQPEFMISMAEQVWFCFK